MCNYFLYKLIFKLINIQSIQSYIYIFQIYWIFYLKQFFSNFRIQRLILINHLLKLSSSWIFRNLFKFKNLLIFKKTNYKLINSRLFFISINGWHLKYTGLVYWSIWSFTLEFSIFFKKRTLNNSIFRTFATRYIKPPIRFNILNFFYNTAELLKNLNLITIKNSPTYVWSNLNKLKNEREKCTAANINYPLTLNLFTNKKYKKFTAKNTLKKKYFSITRKIIIKTPTNNNWVEIKQIKVEKLNFIYFYILLLPPRFKINWNFNNRRLKLHFKITFNRKFSVNLAWNYRRLNTCKLLFGKVSSAFDISFSVFFNFKNPTSIFNRVHTKWYVKTRHFKLINTDLFSFKSTKIRVLNLKRIRINTLVQLMTILSSRLNLTRNFNNYNVNFSSIYYFKNTHQSNPLINQCYKNHTAYLYNYRRTKMIWLARTTLKKITPQRKEFLLFFRKFFYYQKRITRFVFKFYKLKVNEFLFKFEYNLIVILLKSGLLFNFISAHLLIKAGYIFINSIKLDTKSTSISLCFYDVIQFVLNFKLFLWLRWCKLYYLIKQRRFLYYTYKWQLRRNRPYPQESSYRLPNWILHVRFFEGSIPLYIEIDYITLTCVLIFYNYYNYSTFVSGIFNFAPYGAVRNYNWKSIV